jgi:hypothetical protein
VEIGCGPFMVMDHSLLDQVANGLFNYDRENSTFAGMKWIL